MSQEVTLFGLALIHQTTADEVTGARIANIDVQNIVRNQDEEERKTKIMKEMIERLSNFWNASTHAIRAAGLIRYVYEWGPACS